MTASLDKGVWGLPCFGFHLAAGLPFSNDGLGSPQVAGTSCTPRVSVGREADSLRRVSGWMLFKRPVELAMPSGFVEPGVWGIRIPVLLLPQGMTKEMTDAELESVILHELIHVERYDNFIAAMQRFLCYLFWFHPVVWILDRKLLLEREQVCDELVLGMNIDSSVYATSLVKVTRFCLDGKLAGLLASPVPI